MKQNKLYCVMLVIMLVILSFPVAAHPGRTDGAGGHYNRSTGEYHYHHGFSVHQHPNGVCPYDYEDKTNHNSSGISAKSENRIVFDDNNDKNVEKEPQKNSWATTLVLIGVGGIALWSWGGMLWMWCVDIFGRIKNKKKRK